MPRVSADGRTYTFRIRDGLPFLAAVERARDGGDVQAHARARLLAEARPRRARAERGARDRGPRAVPRRQGRARVRDQGNGDTLSITLVKPSGDFLGRISLPHLCPVPLSVPVRPTRPTALCRRPGRTTSRRPRTAASCCCRTRATAATGRSTGRESSTRSTSRRSVAVALVDRGSLDYLPLDFDLATRARALGRARPTLRAGERRRGARGQRYFPTTAPSSTTSCSTRTARSSATCGSGVRSTTRSTGRCSRGVPRRPGDQIVTAGCRRLSGRRGLSGRRARPHDCATARGQPGRHAVLTYCTFFPFGDDGLRPVAAP